MAQTVTKYLGEQIDGHKSSWTSTNNMRGQNTIPKWDITQIRKEGKKCFLQLKELGTKSVETIESTILYCHFFV